MLDLQPSLQLLFLQLGLDASDDAIGLFIETHQLPAHHRLYEADFWSESQRQFLKKHLANDDDWAMVIDELNQQLHVDSDLLPH